MSKTKHIDMFVTGTVVGDFKAEHIIKIPSHMEADGISLGQEFLRRQYGPKVYEQMVDVAINFPEPEQKDKK